ncbi:hypothetical protein [Gilvimarinus algae]|uniref:Uncharacterized protein n=1 Tax=Gilvimarinus algae TaxID=3058037 RepID=A0ABT8TC35_9GAMM|nr:hypothetical protein [Gilvimarinus sp. SDUM040014]MDO3381662.1 hypothetical protein [Gilvimarinus sp. SDUM040014]
MHTDKVRFAVLAALLLVTASTLAHEGHSGGLKANESPDVAPSFDIVHAKVSVKDNRAHFHMASRGAAGSEKPQAQGQLGGSEVYSYVWPTTIGPEAVGFAANSGILALAVTIHPDFDDTPLFDENRDNNTENDGDTWHSHWVVLAPDPKCGDNNLGVVDIPEGATPPLPATWPGLPLLIDSPGWQPVFGDHSVDVHLAFNKTIDLDNSRYDGVTAALRVNESIHAPLLCVENVFDTASGDLSLPADIERH